MATGPNQTWSWDITKLKTFIKSQYLHLYVILDLYSRYAVSWRVETCESGELAKELMKIACERQGIQPGLLTMPSDNGPAMVSQSVASLLIMLDVAKSHSRPHVSDYNPFSEAQFKTLKYRPNFPERFASLDPARQFLREFFTWYNTQHCHSRLALLTPHDVHHGLVDERVAHVPAFSTPPTPPSPSASSSARRPLAAHLPPSGSTHRSPTPRPRRRELKLPPRRSQSR
jgi:putative transposase